MKKIIEEIRTTKIVLFIIAVVVLAIGIIVLFQININLATWTQQGGLLQKLYVYMETVEETGNKDQKTAENGVFMELVLLARNSQRGYWFTTYAVVDNMVMTKERLMNSGFYDLTTA